MQVPKVYNMSSPRTGAPVANQYIIDAGEKVYFQSYSSIIACQDYSSYPVKVTLDKTYWDYSRTTGKYRNSFLDETMNETRRKIKSGEYILANLNPEK